MGMVSYTFETLPPVSKKELDRVDAINDEEIDCSDIPEINSLSGLKPRQDRKLYKPVKVAVTCKLDADVVAWLKLSGKAYQARVNTILRQVMTHTS